MAATPDSDDLRAAVFAFLQQLQDQHGPYLKRAQINSFTYGGEPLRLMEQYGITKPSGWADALAITSTSRPADQGGYDDVDRDDGTRLYRYMRQGSTAAPSMNASLDEAVRSGRPLVYFVAVGEGFYEPIFPVFLIGTEASGVLVSDQPASGEYAELVDLRRYATRQERVRLHQQEFRSRVLFAYEDRCCICAFRHRGLLDAAHIIDDAQERGHAVVTNGLSMCRIHHGAYDQFLLGISPDLRIELNQEVLQEVDGPMLQHGLKEMHGRILSLPRRRKDQPDPDRLAWKYERFQARSA